MKLYIGADHNGYRAKADIITFLTKSGHEVIDCGNDALKNDDDFPTYASLVAQHVLADNQPDVRGILICGSGQGMCMAANRFKGIRASICWNLTEARAARNDDDSNVLCLSSRYMDGAATQAIITTWLATPFAGAERFKRRLHELDNLN